ncbi:MAG: glutamate 5-kinase [Acidimicrobiales bacterium]
MILIVKIGTSSLTDYRGQVRQDVIERLCDQVAETRATDLHVVLVSSGAIGAGLPALGYVEERPRDARTLQAASAVGQSRLMAGYERALGRHGLVAGQILLAPFDFFERTQYLHARGTLERLLQLGVVPIINENDAVADDAIRFGDNDRIAALVANLLGADRLVLLTDTDALYTSDPKTDASAAQIREIRSIADELPVTAGGAGTDRGSGGMASKVQAARMAAYSGVTTVIAAAEQEDVVRGSLAEHPEFGTIVRPQPRPLSARKLWIGFAVEPQGQLVVDDGAQRALRRDGGSLLAVGVKDFSGAFGRGDAVDVAGTDGTILGRGLAAVSSQEMAAIVGVRSSDHPVGTPDEVIHRDELVIL